MGKQQRWAVEYGMSGYMPATYEIVETKAAAIDYALTLLDNGEGAPRGAKTALRQYGYYQEAGDNNLWRLIITAVVPQDVECESWAEFDIEQETCGL